MIVDMSVTLEIALAMVLTPFSRVHVVRLGGESMKHGISNKSAPGPFLRDESSIRSSKSDDVRMERVA